MKVPAPLRFKGAWVHVGHRMPPAGKPVLVHGDYTPDGMPKPTATRRKVLGKDQWSSTEWRGSVGITHWWDADAQPPTG